MQANLTACNRKHFQHRSDLQGPAQHLQASWMAAHLDNWLYEAISCSFFPSPWNKNAALSITRKLIKSTWSATILTRVVSEIQRRGIQRIQRRVRRLQISRQTWRRITVPPSLCRSEIWPCVWIIRLRFFYSLGITGTGGLASPGCFSTGSVLTRYSWVG